MVFTISNSSNNLTTEKGMSLAIQVTLYSVDSFGFCESRNVREISVNVSSTINSFITAKPR